jgi:hypothetical protein
MPDIAKSSDGKFVELAEYPYAPQPPRYPAPESELAAALDVTRPERRFSVLAIVLAVVFLYGNLAIVPMMDAINERDWLASGVFVMMGAICAQIALACAAVVFVEAPFWRRLLVCWCAAILLWGAWVVGVSASLYRNRDLNGALEIIRFTVLAMPLAALAIQSPLWFFRLYLGWRVCDSKAQPRPMRALSIRDYMLGTAMVALAITAARLAPPKNWNRDDYWPVWAVFIAIVAGISLIAVAPALFLMFRCSRWWVGYCLLLLYGLFGGLAMLAFVVIVDEDFRQRVFTASALWEALGMMTVIFSFAVVLGAGLKAARDLGFELVIGRRADAGRTRRPSP